MERFYLHSFDLIIIIKYCGNKIERIRNDTQICDGLKNIQISLVQTLISRAYEKIEEERVKTPRNN